jgi:hypothetical protein
LWSLSSTSMESRRPPTSIARWWPTRSGSIILGREGRTLNYEVVIEVLPPLIDATCGRGFRSSRCPTSWLPGMTRSPQDHPTTLFPPLTL